jgi:hypothetical protein
VDRAATTLAFTTAILRASQPQDVTQYPQQGHVGVNLQRLLASIDYQIDLSHQHLLIIYVKPMI